MRSGVRVLVVGPYPREEGKIIGGVEAVTYYQTEGLAARGLDVYVITASVGLESEQRRTSQAGTNVRVLPQTPRFGCLTGFAADSARIRKAMHEVKPDLVHVHTQTTYPFAALERGYPSVLTPHGVLYREVQLTKGAFGRFQARLACLYERNALRRAKHIILLNNYLVSCYGNMLGRAKTHFICNPIDDRFFDVSDEAQPGEILFLGVVYERKGLMHLAEAARILKANGARFEVKAVGPVSDHDYLARVKDFVKANGLEENFEFLGLVSEDEVMRRYARCSMLVLPSFEETAPMCISQAQAAGKPVVATAVGGIPEMVEDDVTGYTVAFADPEALADRIGRLLADPELGKRMGQRAKQVAEERYRRSSVIDKTLAVYEEVLAEAAR